MFRLRGIVPADDSTSLNMTGGSAGAICFREVRLKPETPLRPENRLTPGTTPLNLKGFR